MGTEILEPFPASEISSSCASLIHCGYGETLEQDYFFDLQ
jgi:hypothetical protein